MGQDRARLATIARAYELHVLPMLGGPARISLGRAQCESLLDELEFVAGRLDDDLSVGTAQRIADYVARRLQSARSDIQVSVEGQ